MAYAVPGFYCSSDNFSPRSHTLLLLSNKRLVEAVRVSNRHTLVDICKRVGGSNNYYNADRKLSSYKGVAHESSQKFAHRIGEAALLHPTALMPVIYFSGYKIWVISILCIAEGLFIVKCR